MYAYSFSSHGFLPPGLFYLLLALVFIFSLYAQFRVSSAYNKNSRIPSRSGLTGRDVAEAVMAQAGIHDVAIVEIGGHLSDHYDPVNKRLALSSDNYRGTSLAALGVAAHESGHAIQHQIGYKMLEFRMALIPATSIVSRILPFVILASWFLVRGFDRDDPRRGDRLLRGADALPACYPAGGIRRQSPGQGPAGQPGHCGSRRDAGRQ